MPSQSVNDGALVEALTPLSFGERLRGLRLARGIKSQAALLTLLEEKTGTRRSAAWLSGIESGSLQPTPERRLELVLALGLEGSEAQLLVDTPDEASQETHDLVAYAAWQGVRLVMADELIRDSGDAAARGRGRAVRDRLRDALTSDDELWTVSGRQMGSLSPFLELPEATRWMLLVEATHMQPFLPYQPISEAWTKNRERAIDRVAEELGLDMTSDQRQSLHRQRVPGWSSLAWARDHEPKALEPATGSATQAALFVADSAGDGRLVRGESTVGSLGWWAACGRYALTVTDVNAEIPVSSAPDDSQRRTQRALFQLPMSLGGVPAAALLGSSVPILGSLGGALSVAATREALARERLRRHQRGSVTTEPLVSTQELFPGIGLLVSLGQRVLRNDLARLITVYVLMWGADHPWDSGSWELPSPGRASDHLEVAKRGLQGYADEMMLFTAPGSAAQKSVSAQVEELHRASRTLRTIADAAKVSHG